MKLHISCGAPQAGGHEDWFVVKPLEGQTQASVAGGQITHDMAVQSLISAGRPVYELTVEDGPPSVCRIWPREPGSVITIEDRVLRTACGHSFVTCHTDHCYRSREEKP